MNRGRRTVRRVWTVVVMGVLGCILGLPFPDVASSQPKTTQHTSCGSTAVRSDGRLPAWSMSAHPPSGVPYALSTHGDVIAILFGNPLRSGHPTGHSNKILWIVRQPRNSQPLHVTAHPLHLASPSVRVGETADSSPGEIYPSIIDVPTRGCWHLLLQWGGNRASLDLRYL
jgi:hypothetical protein